MDQKTTKQGIFPGTPVIITAGSTYLDIDAYACCVAMRELLARKGENAIAYSCAPCNYSVCRSLLHEGQIVTSLPTDLSPDRAKYIIVDVSDPEYIKDGAPLDQIIGVYDHHAGFEAYWQNRIGGGAHIEFIGAAATLVYREWKHAGLQDEMTRETALLLIAAILDNTLNLTSSNTTGEDIAAFHALCGKENIGEEWCASYFSEVQKSVEADLKNALFGDIKRVGHQGVLPARIAQLCVWDGGSILERLTQISQWFNSVPESWMLNIVDIKHRCSYFVCDDPFYQKEIGRIFGLRFQSNVARSPVSYLRKQIIKKAYYNGSYEDIQW